MSKLVWDAVGAKMYESGVSCGVLYPQVNGAYPTGVAWNGLTSVSESPEGAEANDLWADNIKYASLRSAETAKGTIEAFTSPSEFDACDGSVELVTGVTIGQQTRQPFGLCYRTEIGTDANPSAGYKLHIVYGATASPSEQTHETINDSPDAMTFSWEYDTVPVEVEGHKPTATLTIDSTKVDANKMTALEAALYGSTNSEPYLPLPTQIVSLITGQNG